MSWLQSKIVIDSKGCQGRQEYQALSNYQTILTEHSCGVPTRADGGIVDLV
jgi:hypothetical protein